MRGDFFDTNVILYLLDDGPKADRAETCLAAGGTVFTSWCCKSNNGMDFPNLCSTACGCAPDPSVSDQVKMCNCGTGKCWDGSGCVTQ